MPRLSVDIDLTYIPASNNRNKDLQNIRSALERVKEQLKRRITNISFADPIRAEEDLKLICTTPDAMVKIEVNQINRGIIAETEWVMLCDKAQETLDKFCEVRMVSRKQHPAIRWKLLNIKKLRESNPQKHSEQVKMLKQMLMC